LQFIVMSTIYRCAIICLAALWAVLQFPAPIAKAVSAALDDWLVEEVPYIISDQEKEAFRSLSGDAERQRFIEAFWQLRDPTPGTITNEFREEHYRRIDEANSRYGANGKPGWRTDMGRIYIMLGKPLKTKTFYDANLNGPVHAWYYPPDKTCGIKYYYYIVFFKRSPKSDFIIYRPDSHGPGALISDAAKKRNGIQSVTASLNALLHIDPLLGQLSLSLLPLEHRPIMMDNKAELRRALGRRTAASKKLLYSVLESRNYRQKEVFRKLKSIMSGKQNHVSRGRFTRKAFEGAWRLDVLRDSDGVPRLYYCFTADERDVGFNEYRGRCYSVLRVSAEAIRNGGSLVLKKEQTVTATFSNNEIGSRGAVTVAYQEVMSPPPGSYSVRIRVLDLVARRSFVIESDVEVPAKVVRTIEFGPAFLIHGKERVEPGSEPGSEPYSCYGVRYRPNAGARVWRGSDSEFYYQLFFSRHDRVSDVTIRYQILSGGRVLWQSTEKIAQSDLQPDKTLSRSVRIPTGRLPAGAYKLRLMASTLSPPIVRRELDFTIAAGKGAGGVPKLSRVTY